MDYTNSPKTKDGHVEKIRQKIKKSMDPVLYKHSMATLDSALHLYEKHFIKNTDKNKGSQKYARDTYRLSVSALLHDYAKIFSYEELVDMALENRWDIDKFSLNCRPILHGIIGDFVAERDFGISDRKILDAIKYHSTGRKNMSIIEKIIYISDKIEKTREYEGVGVLRRLSEKDLDICLLEVYKRTVIYVLNKNQALHPQTCGIWNNICGGVDLNVIR